MDTLLADLRYGLRLLRKTPIFVVVTIGTLALGIGANTAIFSTMDAVLIRPLPFANPDRLVMVWEDASFVGFPRNTPAPANYFDWKDMNGAFVDMAATRGTSANLTLDGPPEQVVGRRVTANFFPVLGVKPMLGRTFTPDEDRTGAAVVVISHGLWQRRYSGRADAVGAAILMNGSTQTIIGVMPPNFVYRDRDMDFWIPIQFTPADRTTRNSHYLNVVARLRDGMTIERAREDMRSVAARLATSYPDSNGRLGAVVIPIKEDAVRDTGLELLVLMGAAGCVLLIACANLTSLLLSRAMSRRGEMAVRAAIGATPTRLVRQMVVEAMILAVAGGALGLAAAPAGVTMLGALVPTGVAASGFSRLDPRVLVFTAFLSIATGVLFSILPAVQAARASLQDALQHGGRSGIGDRRAVARDGLVIAQVAAALVLLTGAGLMLRTLANLRAIDIGFRADHVLTMRTTLPTPKYADPARRLAFYERVVADVRALPGVENAAYVSTLPFQSIGNTNSYRIESRTVQQGQDALMRVGTNDYLKTMDVQLVAGRLPDDRDTSGAPPIVVINETFARMHWPDESPLGHRVSFGLASSPWRTIVGIVKDVHERGYELEMKPGAYVPYAQMLTSWFPEWLAVRASGDPRTLGGAIRRIVSAVDPEQPIAAVHTMPEIVGLNVVDRSQQTVLLGVFAALALLLAATGLYGVLSYAVTQRSREIGLRIALGASAGTVVRMIVQRGLALTGLGLAAGMTLAAGATRALSTLLYGVGAGDPGTFGLVVALLGLVALSACSVPAIRAARVDPMTALRQE
jgi:putative ABC transport system permease protein